MTPNYEAIIQCPCCQIQLYYCRWANGSDDWSVVRQRVKTLSGCQPESWCVFGDSPLHNLGKQTDWICRGLCLDEVITFEAELQSQHTNTHIHTGASTQRQSHTLMSFYSNAKQTVHACGDPTPAEKREKAIRQGKNRHKSKIQSGSEDECCNEGYHMGICSNMCFTLCMLFGLFKKRHLKKDHILFTICKHLPLHPKVCWTIVLTMRS